MRDNWASIFFGEINLLAVFTWDHPGSRRRMISAEAKQSIKKMNQAGPEGEEPQHSHSKSIHTVQGSCSVSIMFSVDIPGLGHVI